MSSKIKSLTFGDHKWMAENLNELQFQNGDAVPLTTDDASWELASQEEKPACCYYENNPGEFGSRGLLYNSYAILDPRGLMPKGWRLPTVEECRQLINLHGGENTAGRLLRSQKGWADGPFMSMSSFKGLPNGHRCAWGEFEYEGYYGFWLLDGGQGKFSELILRGDNIDALIFPSQDKGTGYSIRGIR